ncbi:YigZ family protein [Flavobacterium sp. F372]|uniref:YigZ family protein n=1 Tax=Flavobacterium bernardetii TaxID=2813823 RepID=A0ABR7IUB4_9FLAO|nr:YigZ family protein [Flavobacterium bernardetii]MBC5833354.1 YigZ family protein [Flavobacterium bernardetii]NHF68586.1 YigZ family protein [Flavobacterium bernardetii]
MQDSEIKDTYNTIDYAVENILFKEKNSKFIGYAFPITSENEVKTQIENLKKDHFSARHWCYAYQIGTENIKFRANDDGEPSNSAGMPIYGQIQSFDITNVLIVVVRYFGGVKLGVGGLISAYKTTAQLTLEEADIVEKTIDKHFKITFDYKNMNKVMRIIKEKNIDIVNQKMELNCEIEIATRKKNAKQIFDIFSTLFEIEIKEVEE